MARAARPRRVLLLVLVLFLFLYIYVFFFGKVAPLPDVNIGTVPRTAHHEKLSSLDTGSLPTKPIYPGKPKFTPLIRPLGHNYSRYLVAPAMPNENVEWMQRLPNITPIIYDPITLSSPFGRKMPNSRGREAMIYLSFIIERYDALPDITLFMHAHQKTWHNADLLGNDAEQMITRLSNERVSRHGYMNLNCQHAPGCSDGVHPHEDKNLLLKQEQTAVAHAWPILFPGEPLPDTIRQPCCAQFAVTRELIRATPRISFKRWRDWLLHQRKEDDEISGRVFEQLWHVLFTGEIEMCPNMRVCYCDGFGVCFHDDTDYDMWFKLRYWWREAFHDLSEYRTNAEVYRNAILTGDQGVLEKLEKPEPAAETWQQKKMDDLKAQMDLLYQEALRRGKNPKIRALQSGRSNWKEGDGW